MWGSVSIYAASERLDHNYNPLQQRESDPHYYKYSVRGDLLWILDSVDWVYFRAAELNHFRSSIQHGLSQFDQTQQHQVEIHNPWFHWEIKGNVVIFGEKL